jgi:hypothetical protein
VAGAIERGVLDGTPSIGTHGRDYASHTGVRNSSKGCKERSFADFYRVSGERKDEGISLGDIGFNNSRLQM